MPYEILRMVLLPSAEPGVQNSPAGRGTMETEGLLATYVYNPDEATSDLVLLDAAAPDAAPVSVIRMPQRVPAGLHGIWVPG